MSEIFYSLEDADLQHGVVLQKISFEHHHMFLPLTAVFQVNLPVWVPGL